MAEIPIPDGYGLPLVDLATKLLPAATMAEMDTRYQPIVPEPGIKVYADLAELDAVQETEIGTLTVTEYRPVLDPLHLIIPANEGGDIFVESILNISWMTDATMMQVASVTWWESSVQRKFVRNRGKYGAGAWNPWSNWVHLLSPPVAEPSAVGNRAVYIPQNATATGFYLMAEAPTASSIPTRTTGGRVKTATPTANDDAATKLYADTGGWAAVPASPTSSGVTGAKARDANFLYICIATNSWRRTPLSTW